MTNSVTFSAPNFSTSFAPTSSLNRLAGGFAGEFAGREQRGHKTVAGELLGFRRISSGTMLSVISRFFLPTLAASSFCAAMSGWMHFLAEFQRGVEVRLGDFLGRAFIHHDVVFVADINEIEIALGLFGVRRIGDELAVDAADAHRAERAGPRNVADHQRGARADDAQNIGIVLAVGAQHARSAPALRYTSPSGKSGRIGRSVSRQVRISFSVGRPSRLK